MLPGASKTLLTPQRADEWARVIKGLEGGAPRRRVRKREMLRCLRLAGARPSIPTGNGYASPYQEQQLLRQKLRSRWVNQPSGFPDDVNVVRTTLCGFSLMPR